MSRRAVFTIARAEHLWLPVWAAYYARAFAPENTFVLDHGGTAPAGPFVRRRVDRPRSDDVPWLLETVSAFQRELFGRGYEVVVFAEADEFLLPDPAHYRGLADYLDRLAGPAARATGYDVCWAPADPPLDPARPILRQRPRWHQNPLFFDKTLISRTPLEWVIGFHHTLPRDAPADPRLVLAHTHYADREAAWARLAARHAGAPPDPGPWSGQNKPADRAEFDADFARVTPGARPIPERFLDLV